MKTITYKKYIPTEDIRVGDIVSLVPEIGRVTRSGAHKILRKMSEEDELVIGVCVKTNDDEVQIINEGIVDVNVEGIICVGDKLTPCSNLGKARAIKYSEDEKQFGVRCIGKVIGLYNSFKVAKVLLNIE